MLALSVFYEVLAAKPFTWLTSGAVGIAIGLVLCRSRLALALVQSALLVAGAEWLHYRHNVARFVEFPWWLGACELTIDLSVLELCVATGKQLVGGSDAEWRFTVFALHWLIVLWAIVYVLPGGGGGGGWAYGAWFAAMLVLTWYELRIDDTDKN